MKDFIYNNFTHFLCLMVLISRLADILSTYLITPTLKLESNPIVKKLGWKFLLLSLVLCVVPYYYTPSAVIIIIPSLLVAASNIGKFWVVKGMGETEYLKLNLMIASKSRLSYALFSVMTSSLLVFLVLC